MERQAGQQVIDAPPDPPCHPVVYQNIGKSILKDEVSALSGRTLRGNREGYAQESRPCAPHGASILSRRVAGGRQGVYGRTWGPWPTATRRSLVSGHCSGPRVPEMGGWSPWATATGVAGREAELVAAQCKPY